MTCERNMREMPDQEGREGEVGRRDGRRNAKTAKRQAALGTVAQSVVVVLKIRTDLAFILH